MRFVDERGYEKDASCGTCRRCLDICPTHAFPASYVLDSNRCISYLTIELKGAMPVELRSRVANWIFGCDACQSVCPWVHRYARPSEHPFLSFEPERCVPSLLDLMALDDDGFRKRFKGTPMKRAKRRGLLRNVAVALGNWGDAAAVPVLERALHDPEPLIREHAAWALDVIRG
jgi:epoxyqueuosine reductase